MAVHPLAGKKAPVDTLVDIPALLKAYETNVPDVDDPAQRVAFGTSGHRGSSINASFTEAHILAITQAVCEYRAGQGISGPLYLGVDTHALSAPAARTALEVLAANGVQVRRQKNDLPTPTPVISRNILRHNNENKNGLADGIVVTPSHNPPSDGGFKYNPPHGGPADTEVTAAIEARANELLAAKLNGVKRLDFAAARKAPGILEEDFIMPYVRELAAVVDMEAIQESGLRLAVDPLGGSSLPYWEPIAVHYGLNLTVVNKSQDPTFGFMPLDHDGKIRMDCSSPWAMAGLLAQSGRYDLAFGNDPDADRHGIVTPKGLMNPNHYLSACIWYLFQHRPIWPATAAVGKTLVSSSMIDKVAEALSRPLYEVPVGFKWFVEPLLGASCAFGGEESAGASFLRKEGTVWTTDKDGLILNLLAAELTARLGMDPADAYDQLTSRFGAPCYERLDAPATPEQKKRLSALSPDKVKTKTLAGSPITTVLTRAPGNNASIGGLKVVTKDGWFAARPSGTEDIYKIYAESFLGPEHLAELQEGARQLVSAVLA